MFRGRCVVLLNIIMYGTRDRSFLEKDLAAAGGNLCIYLKNCLDGFVSVVPNILDLCIDGIPNYIIYDGVATQNCDEIINLLLVKEISESLNRDDCFTFLYFADTQAIRLVFSPPPGQRRYTFQDMAKASMYQFGCFTAEMANVFVNAKAMMYKQRFNETFPMRYAGETVMSLVDRINICLYNGEPADLLAKRHNWK